MLDNYIKLFFGINKTIRFLSILKCKCNIIKLNSISEAISFIKLYYPKLA